MRLVASLASAAVGVGAKAFSDFVSSDEGWTITGDPTVTKPKHSVALGSPDGFISATDSGTGSWFFSAPDNTARPLFHPCSA